MHRGTEKKVTTMWAYHWPTSAPETVRKFTLLWLCAKKTSHFSPQPLPTKTDINSSGIKPLEMRLGRRGGVK